MKKSIALGFIFLLVVGISAGFAKTKYAAAETSYPESEIAAHNTSANCWTIIDGGVYDVSPILDWHKKVITCGGDSTSLYLGKHNDLSLVASYKIGIVATAPAPPIEVDTDGDGVPDNADAFPNDPSEQVDSDGDGVGDNADAFPLNPNETKDTDGDTVGDNADAFPNDPSEQVDSDGDGVGDNADAFPNDPTKHLPDNPTTPPTTPPSTQKNFNLTEIAAHNTEADCWIIVYGGVYDVTPVMADYSYFYTCGADNSDAWTNSMFKGDTTIMQPYMIGELVSQGGTNTEEDSSSSLDNSSDVNKEEEHEEFDDEDEEEHEEFDDEDEHENFKNINARVERRIERIKRRLKKENQRYEEREEKTDRRAEKIRKKYEHDDDHDEEEDDD